MGCFSLFLSLTHLKGEVEYDSIDGLYLGLVLNECLDWPATNWSAAEVLYVGLLLRQ